MQISNVILKTLVISFIGINPFLQIICQTPKHAILRGKLIDPAGSVISDAKVVLMSDNSCFEVLTSDSGDYVFEIAPGVYTLHVAANNLGFAPIVRGPFRLQITQDNVLNVRFRLPNVFRGSYQGKQKQSYDDVPLSYARTDYVSIESSFEINMGQVTYGTKKVKSDNTIYDTVLYAPGENTLDQRTTFTFDLFAVTADKIEVNLKSMLIVARGKPMTEENGNRVLLNKDAKFHVENGLVRLLE